MVTAYRPRPLLPHFVLTRVLKPKAALGPIFSQAAGRHCSPPECSFVDRQKSGLPLIEDIRDAYFHGCNGRTLFVWIERKGSDTIVTMATPVVTQVELFTSDESSGHNRAALFAQ